MNGNMNGKDFFEMLGELDEDIVEDAWTEKNGIIVIAEESGPLSFWKIAAATAACIALAVVGVYGFIKLKPVDIVSPNNSDVSYAESSAQESENSENGENSEPSEVVISDEEKKFEALGILGNYAPMTTPIEADQLAFVQKSDRFSFAVFNVERTNTSEDKPVYITVCRADYSALNFLDPVSETIKITGVGKYVAYYDKQFPINSISYLHAETCGESYGDGGIRELDGLLLEGTWLP